MPDRQSLVGNYNVSFQCRLFALIYYQSKAKAVRVKVSTPKSVLVISSQVAASQVGSGVTAFCLRRLGHEAVVLPTTLMGRHPGWGAPGGGAVKTERLTEMWSAIRAQGLRFDAVMTGYMGEAAQIDLAAQIIADVRADNPDALVLVDPVMGDNGTLYIPEARAAAIRDKLVPLADIITPNLWELSWLSSSTDLRAARNYKQAIVTSVPAGELIGAVLSLNGNAHQASHAKFARVPHGGGDALAGLYLGHVLTGLAPREAFAKSLAAIFAIMKSAQQTNAAELPLIANQDQLQNCPPLPVTEIDL